MKKRSKVAIVVTFFAIATGVVISRQNSPSLAKSRNDSNPTTSISRPRLLDLGSHSCIPCKMMTPILDTLSTRYEGRLVVEFIDVWADPEAGKKYSIRSIPTQIFFDSTGTELFRHEGFWTRAEIEAKFVELGINIKGSN